MATFSGPVLELPLLQALLFADGGQRESPAEKFSLRGIFSALYVPSVPVVLRGKIMYVSAALAGGAGILRIDFLNPVLALIATGYWQIPATFAGGVVEAAGEFPPVPLTMYGYYQARASYNAQPIGGAILHVRELGR